MQRFLPENTAENSRETPCPLAIFVDRLLGVNPAGR